MYVDTRKLFIFTIICCVLLRVVLSLLMEYSLLHGTLDFGLFGLNHFQVKRGSSTNQSHLRTTVSHPETFLRQALWHH